MPVTDLFGLNGQLPTELQNRLETLIGGLAAEAGAAPQVLEGVIASARLPFATDATNADEISIGGKVFRFLTTLIAADTFVQVKRGTSAAATLGALVKAINGTVSAAEWVEATTPFAVTIKADAVTATALRIRFADARGGVPIPGPSGSIALAETLTPAASIWNCANLNVSGSTAAVAQRTSRDKVTITAAMVTAGSYFIELPFTPVRLLVSIRSATGAVLVTTDLITISGNGILITLAGGVAPALVATDVVSFEAST